MIRHRLPKYVHRYKDRHGKWRTYLRLPKAARVALPEPIFSEEFWSAYHRGLKGDGAEKPSPAGQRSAPGSFDALIAAYYKSAAFTGLEKSTQRTYRSQLEPFRLEHGSKPVSDFKTKHVDAILGTIAERSTAQAHKLRKRLSTLMRLAVKWEYTAQNPMVDAERVSHKVKGYPAWTEEDIRKFRQRWEEGAPQRVAFEILLYTGLRRSDAVRLGWRHIQDGQLVIATRKSGGVVELSIPIHNTFQKILEARPKADPTFIVTQSGFPRSEKAFTNWFSEAAKEAGLPAHRSPHGIRKAACRNLAEAGCTALEIISITGHQNLKELETYCASVNRRRLANSAIQKAHAAA